MCVSLTQHITMFQNYYSRTATSLSEFIVQRRSRTISVAYTRQCL